MVSFCGEVKIFRFWLKTMDYNPWFKSPKSKKVLRKVFHPKGNDKRNLMALVSDA